MSRLTMSVVLLMVAGAVSVNSANVANSATAAGTFTNPLSQRGPDPWLQYFDGFHYLATSSFSNTITMRLLGQPLLHTGLQGRPPHLHRR